MHLPGISEKGFGEECGLPWSAGGAADSQEVDRGLADTLRAEILISLFTDTMFIELA